REVMRIMINKAQRQPMRIAFPEGEEDKILRASQILVEEKIAFPILLGNQAVIRKRMAELHVNAATVRIIDPAAAPEHAQYAAELYKLRQRKGVTEREAEHMARNHTTFGALMVRMGDADALIGGLTQHYPDTIRPALQVIAVRPGLRKVSGVYVLITP